MTKLTFAVALLVAGSASAEQLPSAVTQLKQSAHALPSHPDDPMHVSTVATMREMASALRAMRGIPSEHADAIEAQANAIERSKRTSRMHEDAAKIALEHAIMGLESLPPCSGLNAKLATARASVRRIDKDVLFLKQRSTIDDAFGEVADAIGAAASCQQQVAAGEREPV